MLRRVVIFAIPNKKQRYVAQITKSKICVIGMLIGIGLIGLLPLLSAVHVIGHRPF
jgi:hypothetical protein